jgi:trans-aconitate methyltransferase
MSPSRLLTAKEIIAQFDRSTLDEEEQVYLNGQARRFEFLLALVDELRGELGLDPAGRSMRLLDVGPSFQTELFRRLYPEAVVTTLGLEPSAVSVARRGERHITFDLNDAFHPEKWPEVDPHPLVVMAEVIEHLYTSPVTVLRCVAAWLEPSGLLVLQTPNAASLFKRLRLLAGRHPYHPIRGTRTNPGHFREYTLTELLGAVNAAGLEVVRWSRHNYLDPPTWIGGVYRATRDVLPGPLRQGITMVLRRA